MQYQSPQWEAQNGQPASQDAREMLPPQGSPSVLPGQPLPATPYPTPQGAQPPGLPMTPYHIPMPALPQQFSPATPPAPSQPLPAYPQGQQPFSQPVPIAPSQPLAGPPQLDNQSTNGAQQAIPGSQPLRSQFLGRHEQAALPSTERPTQIIPPYPQLPSQYLNSSPHPIVLPGYRQPNRLNANPVSMPGIAPQRNQLSNPSSYAGIWPGYAQYPRIGGQGEPKSTITPPMPQMPAYQPPLQQEDGAQFPQEAWQVNEAPAKKRPRVRRVRRLRRVPMLRQVTDVECGAACLAMILKYYGHATSVSEVQERCGVGRDGLSALTIVKAARQYGLRVRAVSLKQNDFRFISLPAIAHWEFNHFIVIERWSANYVEVLDPAIGRRKLTHEEFDEGFTGVVVMAEPGTQFEKQGQARTLSLRAYMRSFLRMPGIIIQITLASLLLQVLGLGGPLLTEIIVDHVIQLKTPSLLTLLGIGAVILVVSQGLALLLRSSLLIYLQTHLDARMMLNFFEHLLSLPYRFFQLRLSGDLLARMNSNVAIRDLLTNQLVSTFLDGTSIIVYLAILITQSRLIAEVAVGLGLAQVFLLLTTAPLIRTLTQRDLAAQGKTQGYMNEILAGIATLKAAGAEYRAFNRWVNLFFEEMNITIRLDYVSSIIAITLNMLQILSPLLLLWIGATLVLNGSMSLGAMLALNTLAVSFLAPLSSLASSGSSLQIIRAHFERIADVVGTPPEQDPQEVYTPPRLAGHIELRGISFQYDPNAAPTLLDISVVIQAGQKVALVGKTGSGKSTLGKLLIGLMTPTRGNILYDGISLQHLNYQEVRRQFGVVLQESFIFSGSIRENISLNNPEMDLQQVVMAAHMAAIHEDIAKMPMDYETLVSEGGSALSGGQRQRLALARALASRPSILLLDEATSSLDVATERVVEQNLSALSCTQIVIAHRLSTIRNAHLILVLDEGRIVEGGSHNELLRRQGYYAQLIQQQLENGEIEVA
ncbi:MAG TPA: cysteine peptidase family C39 domain-containing protein [Ktedonosporobacter sp.]|nr:cysteine peptidase family C39 domain-containing protein [Ktedonosporobacter sp.]